MRKNIQKVIECYEKAAQQGVPEAQFNHGLLYMHGEGVDKNIDTAKALFKQAAAQGFDPACEMYEALT